jgi:hypothetical protein
MFSLKITDAAAELIRKELRESAVKNPAVYLLEAKEGLPSAEELARMPLSDAQRHKVNELAAKAAPVVHGERRLVPCVYSRFHFFGLFLVQISGIAFLFPPGLRRKAAGGTLDVGQGALVLRDRTGRIVMPSQQ